MFGLTKLRIAAIAGGLLLAAAGAAWLHYSRLVDQLAKLTAEKAIAQQGRRQAEQAATEQAEENARLVLENDRKDALLAARAGIELKLRKERGNLYAEIERLRKRPDIAAWLNAAVPASILERLRARAAGDAGADHRAQDNAPGAAAGAAH